MPDISFPMDGGPAQRRTVSGSGARAPDLPPVLHRLRPDPGPAQRGGTVSRIRASSGAISADIGGYRRKTPDISFPMDGGPAQQGGRPPGSGARAPDLLPVLHRLRLDRRPAQQGGRSPDRPGLRTCCRSFIGSAGPIFADIFISKTRKTAKNGEKRRINLNLFIYGIYILISGR